MLSTLDWVVSRSFQVDLHTTVAHNNPRAQTGCTLLRARSGWYQWNIAALKTLHWKTLLVSCRCFFFFSSNDILFFLHSKKQHCLLYTSTTYHALWLMLASFVVVAALPRREGLPFYLFPVFIVLSWFSTAASTCHVCVHKKRNDGTVNCCRRCCCYLSLLYVVIVAISVAATCFAIQEYTLPSTFYRYVSLLLIINSHTTATCRRFTLRIAHLLCKNLLSSAFGPHFHIASQLVG